MSVLLGLMWMLLGLLAFTGRPHRWLRAQGLGRHPSALAQALVLAALWVFVWVSFEPSLNYPLDQLALIFAFTFLLLYGSILLRLRWMHAS
jgi:hypothetical protein